MTWVPDERAKAIIAEREREREREREGRAKHDRIYVVSMCTCVFVFMEDVCFQEGEKARKEFPLSPASCQACVFAIPNEKRVRQNQKTQTHAENRFVPKTPEKE